MRFEALTALSVCSALSVSCAPAPALENAPAPAVELPPCAPDQDGRITRDELPFVVGAVARVRVGTDVAVDTAGDAARGSARVWDLSRPDPSDQPQGTLTLQPMQGQWFSDAFPEAPLAGPLALENRLLGALSVDDDGVWLHGSASSVEDPDEGRTLMVYDTPALLYPFPLEVGAQAQTESTVLGGMVYGVPLAFQDATTVEVSAHGQVILPDLILDDALRVTVRLERVPVAGVAVQQVTHVWVNECLGEVARMTSPLTPLTEALPDDFTTAHEVWRLGF